MSEPADIRHPGHVEPGASPNEVHDPLIRQEIKKAKVWFGAALLIALGVLLVQPLMVIGAGIILGVMFDGGVRLLGRYLPIGRSWRLLIIVLASVLFLVGTFYLMGLGIVQQVEQLRVTLELQVVRLTTYLTQQGLMPGASDVSGVARQALSSVGRLTSWVGSAVGAVTTMFFILVLGLFFAMEPRVYERGVQWMIPRASRDEFALTLDRMGFTLRRLLAGKLLAMVAQGVVTWLALLLGGVPLAALLGIITGVLAFIPNIGAFVSGVIMVAVGFSAGVDTGVWAIVVYVVVQGLDGYVFSPLVAKKTVDMPPALTLGAQILASALVGLIGLALADSFVAMIKVALERRAEREEKRVVTRSPPN
ncbi:AI-2E family transporter [Sphingomonas sp.]|jgi:predicted PurR-regulated permease PerM|uniref:AI-2E family transporter n=1 Tax=Sphingomonas sp. TaxID=28214 RepID=UPI002D8032EA|nr:AI-2E family transporter [Sphingomonas sp.]HEU0043034.1 AI-2E family transporter [Sphingomonas sp.]